jgi:uncharacterized protein involved in high-affinity Fe2+ transport
MLVYIASISQIWKGVNMTQASGNQQLRISSEINNQQIELAKKQGQAFQDALKNMLHKEAHGDQKVVGDYIVSWANEKAEGMYLKRDGHLEWQEPQAADTHLEIVVCNADDGRFIPGLTVHTTLLDQNRKEIGTREQPFFWHPWLYHYGANWQVPHEGPYTLRVRIEAPDFPRHDKTNGKRFDQPVEVEFSNVRLELGQK